MSTQNANAVAITGGTINGTTIGASTAASIAGTTGNFSGNLASLGSVSGATGIFGAVSGTTITASTQFTGPGTGLTGTAASLSIGGNAATATNAVTVTGATQNNITSIPNLATVGTITSGTWSGSFGAVSGANLTNLNASNLASGTVAAARLSGTYNIAISGNAATASNGGVTSVNGSTGAVTVSTLNIVFDGQIPYNSVTTFSVNPAKTTLFFVNEGNGAGGRQGLFLGVQWGTTGITNTYQFFNASVDFQVTFAGALLQSVAAGSSSLVIQPYGNNIGGYGAPGDAKCIVMQF
jgi:hypothetical protein